LTANRGTAQRFRDRCGLAIEGKRTLSVARTRVQPIPFATANAPHLKNAA